MYFKLYSVSTGWNQDKYPLCQSWQCISVKLTSHVNNVSIHQLKVGLNVCIQTRILTFQHIFLHRYLYLTLVVHLVVGVSSTISSILVDQVKVKMYLWHRRSVDAALFTKHIHSKCTHITLGIRPTVQTYMHRCKSSIKICYL